MEIRLTHIDGKLPNLALMKLAHWHRAQGDEITFSRSTETSIWEPVYDVVYGSTIFQWSQKPLDRLRAAYEDAIIGGTGTDTWQTVEEIIGEPEYEHYDYSIYPDYPFSLGFTQRGCRLNCGFCVVPKKEGKPREINSIWDLWQPDRPRAIVLLDNDFFGQPEDAWRARIAEINEGGFKVSFNQGINIRMITPESAAAIASVKYYNASFKSRRLYTAWDNLGQENVFYKGLGMLNEAGIPSSRVMVYMLIGYKLGETMEEIMYRYRRLKESGCMPYPMVYDQSKHELKQFQRWVIGRFDEIVPWEEYGSQGRKRHRKNLQGEVGLPMDGLH